MKKLIGMIAIATVFSVVMIGCSPPVEGDTATAPATGKTPTDTKAPTTPETKTTG